MRRETADWWAQAADDLKTAELNPEYTVARSPNAAKGIPEQMFNKKSAAIHLRAAQVISEWVAKWLK